MSNFTYKLFSYETPKDCFFNFVNNKKFIILRKQDEIIGDVIKFAQINLRLSWKEIMRIKAIQSYFEDEHRTGSIYTLNYIRFLKLDTFWYNNYYYQ